MGGGAFSPMKVAVVRPHLGANNRIVAPPATLEVSESRAAELEAKNLAVPLLGAHANGARAYANAPAWFPDWRGQTCVIIASGPSAAKAGIETAKGRAKTIAINSSWRLAPWADILYACDYAWWKNHKGVPEFKGLKVSQDPEACRAFKNINRVECVRARDDMLLTRPAQIGWGGNSGFHAVNLAAQFGAAKVVLVGYDLRLDLGLHWHEKHQGNNPMTKNVERWRRAIDNAMPVFAALGIPVINASPVSALVSYPKMTLAEALA
jgi:hypothetical protein